MAKYLCQAPKELADHSAAFRKGTTLDKLRECGYWLQPKYDGCHLIINTRDKSAFSRTGEAVRSVGAITEQVLNTIPHGTWVVFGEFWSEGKTFSEISGDYRRHSEAPDDTIFMMYDAVPVLAYEDGECATPYEERYRTLVSWLDNTPIHARPNISIASNLLAKGDMMDWARKYKEHGGYDGLILRDPEAGWAPGASKRGEVIKIKPVYSLDLKVLGASVVQRATKLGGFLTCDLGGGVPVDVGSGLTQNMLEGIRVDPEIFDGMIAEVEFMGYTNDGSLREPRFKGFRHDKEQADR